MNNEYFIRLINEKDTGAVLSVYKHFVENTIISFEYEAPTRDEYAERIITNTEKYPWLACFQDTETVGFAYASAHRYRPAYQWSAELTIYLASNFQTKGIGRILYETLFSLLKIQGYYTVFAGVSLPNEKSVGFHRALGFEEVGVFKNIGYKDGKWCNTHWFQYALREYGVSPEPPINLNQVRKASEFQLILIAANERINSENR